MIEMRFNADNGAQNDSAALFKDKAWVGLTSKKYGDLKLGRLHSAAVRRIHCRPLRGVQR